MPQVKYRSQDKHNRDRICQHPAVRECNKINKCMKLFEMFDPATAGYQDVSADNSKPKWRESRKTKLTLKQIRKFQYYLQKEVEL